MPSTAGSLGGASDDAGTEYKRGVVAYAVTCGLTDTPLPLSCLTDDSRVVVAVSTETTDPVDDVRVELASGRSVLLQAKRTLRSGGPFRKAVEQWVEAARIGIDPDRQRLVIVSGQVSGPLKRLGDLLDRLRSDHPAELTATEAAAAAMLNELLTDLDEEQRRAVWASGAIWELKVEEPFSSDAREAIRDLRDVVAGRSSAHAAQAWMTLVSAAGRTARQRTGHRMARWMDALSAASIPLRPSPESTAAAILRRREALDAYTARLRRDGSQVDLLALGGDLPPLQLDDADATVDVGVDPSNTRSQSKLIWAFLRRHRVLLTGDPGGGKSTALRQLGAQLTRHDSLPFPVLVSLRGLDPHHASRSFRDQIIDAATKELNQLHRAEITAEINTRLDEDQPLALLLDALDETYDDRHDVVVALQSMMDDLPDGIAVLLATRHVAYAQAATFGWHELELLPPTNVRLTVDAILNLAAEHHGTGDDERETWVRERASWVNRALSDDPALEQTPLLPTFLAILATQRPLHHLPTSRGNILVAIIEDFVLHRELVSRRRPHGEADIDIALRQGKRAFALEASLILESQGHATKKQIINAVTADLENDWGFKRGPASIAATKMARALDEAGVFVFDSLTERVVPRIALMSEVGAAIIAVDDPDSLDEWVGRRIAASQFEALALACTLDSRVLDLCTQRLSQDPGNASLAAAMVRATPVLDDTQLRLVCGAFIRDICSGTREGWRRFRPLLKLPVPSDLVELLLTSMTHLPVEYQTVIRSEVQHVVGYTGPLVHGVDDDRRTFAVRSLPALPGPKEAHKPWSSSLHTELRVPHLHAAEGMLIADPVVAPELTERATARDSNRAIQNGLIDLLERHGHPSEAARIREHVLARFRGWDLSGMLTDIDEHSPSRFLSVFEAWQGTPLSTYQQIAMPELATVMQAAQLDPYSLGLLVPDESEFVRALIRHAASTLGIDVGVLASQVSLLAQRMTPAEGLHPLLALTEELGELPDPLWANLTDPAGATAVFIRALRLGLDQASFAARVLADGPAEVVSEPLHAAIENLARSPRHQRIAAHALMHATSGTVLVDWLSDRNPVLREVAVTVDASGARRRRFLSDDDRKVRIVALRTLIDDDPEDLPAILEKVMHDDPVGWMCRRCGSDNTAVATKCANGKCPTSAPQLLELAMATAARIERTEVA